MKEEMQFRPMDTESLTRLLADIRQKIGLERGVQPKVTGLKTQQDGSLKIVVPDRAEKGMCLGPGGRVIAQLAQELQKHVTVVAVEEQITRRHRMQATLARIEELQEELASSQVAFLNRLRAAIESRLEEEPIENIAPSPSPHPAVALSGGIDSCAAMVLLKEMGFHPIGLTVELEEEHETYRAARNVAQICKKLGCKQMIVAGPSELREVVRKTQAGRIHPCGNCHELILSRVIDISKEHGFETLVTGELLPTGRQSIILMGELLLVHLPAALSLTKYETQSLCKENGFELESTQFGCSLVRQAHTKGWRGIQPSVYRVLRETQANVLTSGQAIQYIRSILKTVFATHEDPMEK
ncbi:hypothetical protein EU545_03240 [Candidatus Thorarchaeota archaeon]|nr:MAG: hypothetical protein EU545_03240 [Candidatus Thorarchaeota archaeon]